VATYRADATAMSGLREMPMPGASSSGPKARRVAGTSDTSLTDGAGDEGPEKPAASTNTRDLSPTGPWNP